MSPIRPEYHPANRLPNEGVLAAVSFGSPVRGNFLTVEVPVPQIGGTLVEVWRTEDDVERSSHDGVETARTPDVLFGTLRANGSLEAGARSAYDRVVEICRGAGYSSLWRVWNHVGGINDDDHGLERYKHFSAGRHDSLTRHGYAKERFPAASAVGMSEPGLLIYFIAGKAEGLQVENPRQVSAYDYPPQYGPRSPSFSRASVVGRELIFVSGTASVVGHETRHLESVAAQLEETIENLNVTLAVAAARLERTASARDLTVTKVYIRGGVDHRAIEPRIREVFPSVLLLQSDICRRELLLEIEGVAVLG